MGKFFLFIAVFDLFVALGSACAAEADATEIEANASLVPVTSLDSTVLESIEGAKRYKDALNGVATHIFEVIRYAGDFLSVPQADPRSLVKMRGYKNKYTLELDFCAHLIGGTIAVGTSIVCAYIAMINIADYALYFGRDFGVLCPDGGFVGKCILLSGLYLIAFVRCIERMEEIHPTRGWQYKVMTKNWALA